MQMAYAVVPLVGLPNWLWVTLACSLERETLVFSLPAFFSFTRRLPFSGAMQTAGAVPQVTPSSGVGVGVGGCGQSLSAGQSAKPSPSLSRPTELASKGRSSCELSHGLVRLL